MEYCPFDNPEEEIVWQTKNFRVLYNLKPIVPGHCLVVPKQHIISFNRLDSEYRHEMIDLCHKVVRAFPKAYNTKQYNMSIQDGVDAGQTVMHLHVHLIPRTPSDLEREWYVAIDSEDRDPAPLEERIKQARILHDAIRLL